ncbi:MAG: beta-ketoacyl synthase N-terminal-like domain-containing protein [Planctomycetales bacterium]|nr:beta-ketoacyl synthase N-terminal-like domain-containing protein [Planctomycetales bacterium]
MQSQKTERADIAIVGIGCWYPGAHGPRELWENILACRRQFRQIPAERLGHAYFSPDVKTPDKTYCQRVAVIDGFKFDGSRFRIPQSTVASTDIAQWLALQVAFLIKLAGERTGFPASRIHPGSRFLDDLNLDSIKAAELISAATRQFGVAGSIDPANFANQTLQAVAETIDQQTNGSPHEHVARQRDPSTTADSLLEIGQRYPTWVRNFVVDFD